MANRDMISRLAASPEFSELKSEFDERRDAAIAKLGRQMFANPEEHDRLEAEKLKAFYAGVDAVLGAPAKFRDPPKKEGNA